MNRSRVLRAALWVPQPPQEVFPFFADAHNLEELTPPWLRFEVRTPSPVAMHEDARIEYRLRICFVPVRWTTRIVQWDPPQCFADEQLRGPYRRWVHVHTFLPRDGGTELGDRVELEPPGGPLAPLVFRWFVRRDVQRVFEYRQRAICERFGGDAGAGRVWYEP